MDAAEDQRARPLVAQGDGVREHPAQGRLADAEVQLRQRLGELLGPEQHRLAPFQDASRQPVGAERLVVDAAPVGGAGVHGHEAIGVVEQVDDADLRLGQAHERLHAAGREGLDVERLELAHELGVRARARVAVRPGPRWRA